MSYEQPSEQDQIFEEIYSKYYQPEMPAYRHAQQYMQVNNLTEAPIASSTEVKPEMRQANLKQLDMLQDQALHDITAYTQ